MLLKKQIIKAKLPNGQFVNYVIYMRKKYRGSSNLDALNIVHKTLSKQ